MANIKKYLDNILSAVFGKDVRNSIHDGIEAINNEVSSTTTRQNTLERKYDEQIKNIAASEPQSAEIVDARMGFDTLGEVIKQKIYHFENVDEMKNCLSLNAGDFCKTLGFYSVYDGGGAEYIITDDSSLIDDGENVHDLTNGFKAKLIVTELNNKAKIMCPYLSDDVGDCYIVQAAGKNIITDLGQKHPNELIEFCRNNNIIKIDYLIITHYHQDHYCGLADTTGTIEGFKQIVNSEYLDFSNCIFILPFTNNGAIWNNFVGSAFYYATAETNIKNFLNSKNLSYHEAQTNEEIILDKNNKFEIFNADLEAYSNYYDETLDYTINNEVVACTDYNNFSLITQFTFGNKVFVGNGDINQKAQEINAEKIKIVDIYKIEHHCNNAYTDENWRNKIVSKIAFSTGGNYLVSTWPDDSVNMLQYLRSTNCQCYRVNSLRNDVIINVNGNDIFADSSNGATVNTLNLKNFLRSINSNSAYAEFGTASTLQNGDNLDNMNEGTMVCDTAEKAQTLLNSPMIDTGFRLFTSRIINSDIRKIQFAVKNQSLKIFYRELTSQGWTEWRLISDYGRGERILQSQDLNDFVEAGNYYTESGAQTQSLSNIPLGLDVAFKMTVQIITMENRVSQTIYDNYGRIFYREYSGSWSDWNNLTEFRMAPTLPNGSDLNNIPVGTFKVLSSSDLATLSNVPNGLSAAFVITTKYMHREDRYVQKIYGNDQNVYIRWQTGTWQEWKKIAFA